MQPGHAQTYAGLVPPLVYLADDMVRDTDPQVWPLCPSFPATSLLIWRAIMCFIPHCAYPRPVVGTLQRYCPVARFFRAADALVCLRHCSKCINSAYWAEGSPIAAGPSQQSALCAMGDHSICRTYNTRMCPYSTAHRGGCVKQQHAQDCLSLSLGQTCADYGPVL